MEFQDDKVLKKVWICEREYTISMSREEVDGFEGSIKMLQDRIVNFRKKYQDRDEQDILIMTLVDIATKDLSKNPNEVSSSELDGRVAAMVSAITEAIDTPGTAELPANVNKIYEVQIPQENSAEEPTADIEIIADTGSPNSDELLDIQVQADIHDNVAEIELAEQMSEINAEVDIPMETEEEPTPPTEAIENETPTADLPTIDDSLGITIEAPKPRSRDIVIGEEPIVEASSSDLPEQESESSETTGDSDEAPNLFSGF